MNFQELASTGVYWTRLGVSLPWRMMEKRRLARMLGFESSVLERNKLAALVRIKNEDFWIELVLRTVCKELDEVIVIDSGSEDKTLEIVRALQAEGLPVQLIEHREAPSSLNLIVNLVLERVMRAEYFYIVDGDELQLQASLTQCKQAVAELDTEKYWRVAIHHLNLNPDNVLMCSQPFSPRVRFQVGKLFNRRKLMLSETMINDGIQQTNGMPFLNQAPHSLFLRETYALHCAFQQRSTIAEWRGNAELNRSYAAQYRQTRYRTEESEYVPLPFFPKEILECKYSAHNHYLPLILGAGSPLI